ncbi:sugar ABC transporter permease [Cohnella fermenti]|uniref:Sugar ABC transporter permease n=1 Tax=Cohnella fermenti TaxID=2565925 RepID=A0A4S4BN18_9BACL|nr:sugar ABC transporter permease [Cohnella fermenti]
MRDRAMDRPLADIRIASASAHSIPTGGEDVNRLPLRKDLRRYRQMYLLALPMVIFYILFIYIPMYGITIAFKDYSVVTGITGSPWVGLDRVREVFDNVFFQRAFVNTLLISLGKIVFGFPVPIALALLLNELRSRWFKGLFQNIMFIPYFLSWIVFAGIIENLFNGSGLINGIRVNQNLDVISFLAEGDWFLGIVFITDIVKSAGWETVIYLAALTGIDPHLYEAAQVDGANRWKQTFHITLPGLANTIVVLLILRVGYLMFAGFEQIFSLYSPIVYDVADILDTFVYRIGIEQGDYSFAAAAGLFQGIIGLTLLFTVNKIAQKIGSAGLF